MKFKYAIAAALLVPSAASAQAPGLYNSNGSPAVSIVKIGHMSARITYKDGSQFTAVMNDNQIYEFSYFIEQIKQADTPQS